MDPKPIRFATFLAPNMYPTYQFIADYVGRKLKRPTELSVGTSFQQFGRREADVGFICGLPYTKLADRPAPPVQLLAAPVLQGERFRNRPIYYSDVIVHRDSAYQSFADLRGCTWAYNEPGSHSGYNLTRHHLIKMGETNGFFGRVVAAGAHQEAIRMVRRGEVDAAAIDCHVLAMELGDNPDLAKQLRVIEALGPSSIPPLVAATHLPERLKAEIKTILLEMDEIAAARERLNDGFIRRFAPVRDTDYDDIRAMVAAAETAVFTELI